MRVAGRAGGSEPEDVCVCLRAHILQIFPKPYLIPEIICTCGSFHQGLNVCLRIFSPEIFFFLKFACLQSSQKPPGGSEVPCFGARELGKLMSKGLFVFFLLKAEFS